MQIMTRWDAQDLEHARSAQGASFITSTVYRDKEGKEVSPQDVKRMEDGHAEALIEYQEKKRAYDAEYGTGTGPGAGASRGNTSSTSTSVVVVLDDADVDVEMVRT